MVQIWSMPLTTVPLAVPKNKAQTRHTGDQASSSLLFDVGLPNISNSNLALAGGGAVDESVAGASMMPGSAVAVGPILSRVLCV